jgi:molybdopterin-guanine dinucleotide biosynthesis protein A
MTPGTPEWDVVVLTGGSSRRMGRDKATLRVAGATLLDRTLAGIPTDVGVVVAGPRVPTARHDARFVQEDPPGTGPVAGLHAALAFVGAPVVVVLAADLPLVGRLPELLVAELAQRWESDSEPPEAVLAEDASGRSQQLCAAYLTDALRRAITEGGTVAGAAMRDVISRLRTSTVSAVAIRSWEAEPTWDIDTPEDLQRLVELLEENEADQ